MLSLERQINSLFTSTRNELTCRSSQLGARGGSSRGVGITYSKFLLLAPIYWRSYSWEEHFVLTLPIRHDIVYSLRCSERKWLLQGNDSFNFKITLDRHSPRRNTMLLSPSWPTSFFVSNVSLRTLLTYSAHITAITNFFAYLTVYGQLGSWHPCPCTALSNSIFLHFYILCL